MDPPNNDACSKRTLPRHPPGKGGVSSIEEEEEEEEEEEDVMEVSESITGEGGGLIR